MTWLESYRLDDASLLLTPSLLVYPEILRRNLAEMVRIAGGPGRLRPHVKTHKCAEIVKLELAAGITKHKCATLAEAEMLADCSVPDVLIAYPQVGPNIIKLLELANVYRGTQFSVVVDSDIALRELSHRCEHAGLTLDTLIDVDTGMHRTGIEPSIRAVELGRQIENASALRFAGLHVYDGQNHQSDLWERQVAVAELMSSVLRFVQQLRQVNISVAKLVCGGTPTFPVFATFQMPADVTSLSDLPIELSPGTCVLSDYNYGHDYRDMSGFQHAALLLTRVVSKPAADLLTVDLGYKAVASDPPVGRRCNFPELPDVEQIQHSEEHLVLRTSMAANYQVGDVLYAVPAHICPTVALHSLFQVIEQGSLVAQWPVSARHRLYMSALGARNPVHSPL